MNVSFYWNYLSRNSEWAVCGKTKILHEKVSSEKWAEKKCLKSNKFIICNKVGTYFKR